jgi:LmbE family N-acetylglucosaminyl deacetylase
MRSSVSSRLAVLCLGLLLTVVARAQRPQFDPQGDYAYDLTATDAAVVLVQLDETGFAWPAGLREGDTAFLEIVLTETSGPAPKIAVARGGTALHQVFEQNARGRRFLDVSPLLASGDGRVTLHSVDATWRPGPTRLYLYRNKPLAGRRVLVLAPHPDDAEIAAFGVYRRTQADVITVTAGDAGTTNFKALFQEPGEHYRVKGWIRAWDSITVPFYGGVQPGRARNLGHYDGLLRRMHGAPATPVEPLRAKLEDAAYFRKLNTDPALRDRPFAPTWEGLVGDLVWELERVGPEVIVAPHPLLDNHADHQFTTIALIDALARWDGDCELYLYTNHNLENEAFPLGDRDAMTGLPAWSGGGLFFRRICSHPLTPGEQKLKLVALEAMHDLRAFDLRESAPPVLTEAMQLNRLRHDYYRRAPRPNELFFVVTREDAVRLREAFLARPR